MTVADLVALGFSLLLWVGLMMFILDRSEDADRRHAKYWVAALALVAVFGLVGISGWAASRPDQHTAPTDCDPQ